MARLLNWFKKQNDPHKPRASGGFARVVACLGNPGRRYENTRHNAGFWAGDYIAKKRGFSFDKNRFESLSGETVIAGEKVLFIKPATYMNLSGRAVAQALRFYKLAPEQLIVLHDDVSLEPGRLRIRTDGSHGGHNGIRSITEALSSTKFVRVKIGVGLPAHPEHDLADWVLGSAGAAERALIEDAVKAAEQALDLLVLGEIQKAMSRYNR